MTGVSEPGRYAQDGDGAWHPMVDGVELGFKPVAVVKVKAPKAAPVEAAPDPVPAAEQPIIIGVDLGVEPASIVAVRREGGGHAAVFIGDPQPVPARELKRMAPRPPARPVPAPSPATRTATPGDVIRAIGEQFGILAATGAHVSTARFKPLVRRNEDEDAARAYAGAVEKQTGRE